MLHNLVSFLHKCTRRPAPPHLGVRLARRARFTIERLAIRLVPSTIWFSDYASDGDWGNVDNWIDDRGHNRLPGPDDDVIIGSYEYPVVTVPPSVSPVHIHSLNLDHWLTVQSGADLQIDAPLAMGFSAHLTVNGNLEDAGGISFGSANGAIKDYGSMELGTDSYVYNTMRMRG